MRCLYVGVLLAVLWTVACSAGTQPAAHPRAVDERPVAAPAEGRELVGEPAPDWSADGWLTGGSQKLSDLRGRVVLMRFFTNTCPFCAASMPALQGLHERYADRGLQVVGFYHPKPFGVRRPRADVQRMTDKWGVTFPVALDTNWTTLGRYWLDGRRRDFTSVSFLIDREGKIRYIHPGPELHPAGGECHRDAAECARHFEELDHAVRVLLGEDVR